MPNALISVTNKDGIVPLARQLSAQGYTILSTGGTANLISQNAVDVVEIAEFTGSPEMLDGRVKTLHPRIFGGILGRPGTDEAELERNDLEPIAIVVVNLYEFAKTITQDETSHDDAIEAIDIGGVSLIRAAAKNHKHVLVAVDPTDYDEICERLSKNEIDDAFRHRMAAKAFRHTAAYDAIISRYLSQGEKFPERMTLTYERSDVMRYGENPHQDAAFYRDPLIGGAFTQIQGKTLSFNNIADTDAAVSCVAGIKETACAIVKHANPCGLAIGSSLIDAYEKAFRTDPTSAFGGIIAFNRELDAETLGSVLDNQFAEVIVAPSLGEGAEEVAKRKKSLRLLTASNNQQKFEGFSARTTRHGMLIQDNDDTPTDEDAWKTLTERQPTDSEREDLVFAWHVVQHVKSNAIVFVRGNATTGIGAGQPNRVISVRIASMRMQEEGLDTAPCVMASDAFFPFRDGIDEAAKAGITAVIQPGGSIRDDEVIEACNEHGIAMIATGMRHFRH